MDIKREIEILDKTSKGIKLFVKLNKKSSKKDICRVSKLFESVAKLDHRNELLIPYSKELLPKNLRYKHLALLILTGIYRQAGNKKYKEYLKGVELLEKKYPIEQLIN